MPDPLRAPAAGSQCRIRRPGPRSRPNARGSPAMPERLRRHLRSQSPRSWPWAPNPDRGVPQGRASSSARRMMLYAPGAVPPELYSGLVRSPAGLRNPERLGLANEVGERPDPHLAHDVPAVDLDRDLAEADQGGDLLVHQAGGDVAHYLALARRQGLVLGADVLLGRGFGPVLRIAFERRGHCIEHVLVAKWLGEEINGASLHGTHRHRYVPMARHEDDRIADALPDELALQVEPTHAGKADVQHDAAGAVGQRASKQFGRRAVQARFEADGSEQAVE